MSFSWKYGFKAKLLHLGLTKLELTKRSTNSKRLLIEKRPILSMFRDITVKSSSALFQRSHRCLINENSFRLIIKTQIHIYILYLYPVSMPISTHYLTKIHIDVLYPRPTTFKMSLQLNSYLTSLYRLEVNPSTPTFPNFNLTETMTNFLFAWKNTQKLLQ